MKNAHIKQIGGFTLIELLVVVLIIGILASVALPQYQRAVNKAKMIQFLPTFKAVVDGGKMYFLANPPDSSVRAYGNFQDLDITVPGLTTYGEIETPIGRCSPTLYSTNNDNNKPIKVLSRCWTGLGVIVYTDSGHFICAMQFSDLCKKAGFTKKSNIECDDFGNIGGCESRTTYEMP